MRPACHPAPAFPPLRSILATIAVAALAGGAAGAQSLVSNGELDLDVAGWTKTGTQSTLTWQTIDHDGCGTGSGSALAGNAASTQNTSYLFFTCVSGVVPGQLYSFGADLRFPTGQDATGTAVLQVLWLGPGTDCSGSFITAAQAQPIVTTILPGTWLRTRSDGFLAPVGAQSAQLRVVLFKEEAGDVLTLRYDGVYLVPGGGHLFGDGFEAGSPCHWPAATP